MIRLLVASLSLLAVPAQAPVRQQAGGDGQPFSEAWLRLEAQRLAQAEYAPPRRDLPAPLAQVGYDAYRSIRFRPEASVWRKEGLPFELQLLHLGYLYVEPISVFVVEGGRARPVRYDPRMFDLGTSGLDGRLPDTLGFAGFRAEYPINRKGRLDEILVFHGASYFRALGQGNVYGLTARGLAVDTALPSGEIFPSFRAFYVERPAPHARHLVVHALLDSPAATGAYRFEITPGKSTEVRVRATLYPRRAIERLGVAPMSSMFLYGENGRGRFDDYRPEVHDSDGLLLWFGNGERLWRPLQNPERLQVSAFRAESLKGFGLMQRDRSHRYEDLEARFERRPSVWVEPTEGFSSGAVFLIEIPSDQETNDNVVAFFTPDEKVKPGVPVHVAYRMRWGTAPEPPAPVATTAATFETSARRIGIPDAKQPYDASARKIVIDFAAPRASRGALDGLDAVVNSSSGAVKEPRVQPNPYVRGVRVTFDFVPSSKEPAELRCFIRRGGTSLSETWSYRVVPNHQQTR